MQKAVEKMVRTAMPSFQKTSKKIKFSTLMANFVFMFLEIIYTIKKIQLRWFQIGIAISKMYANCQLGWSLAVGRSFWADHWL